MQISRNIQRLTTTIIISTRWINFITEACRLPRFHVMADVTVVLDWVWACSLQISYFTGFFFTIPSKQRTFWCHWVTLFVEWWFRWDWLRVTSLTACSVSLPGCWSGIQGFIFQVFVGLLSATAKNCCNIAILVQQTRRCNSIVNQRIALASIHQISRFIVKVEFLCCINCVMISHSSKATQMLNVPKVLLIQWTAVVTIWLSRLSYGWTATNSVDQCSNEWQNWHSKVLVLPFLGKFCILLLFTWHVGTVCICNMRFWQCSSSARSGVYCADFIFSCFLRHVLRSHRTRIFTPDAKNDA